ncbi:hypothetical protein SASPL_133288 [Salvia splendens]|uniref:Uncharacterized protein n=1 Tax=Salvia splendens TaxID=180675 RepID=A0A8X8X2F4_SALSN|nr:hypothetical protein SASPL_133288 [Salvia splendens]
MSNLTFATLFSIEIIQYGVINKEFKEHSKAITRYMGVPNVADFFPIFAPLDPQGMRRKVTHHLGSLLELVQSLIDQRLQERMTSSHHKKSDFLETLLDLSQGNEYDLSIKEIKHLFVDLIIAGLESSAATTEWAMVELLPDPPRQNGKAESRAEECYWREKHRGRIRHLKTPILASYHQ